MHERFYYLTNLYAVLNLYPPSWLQPCTKSLRDLLISHNRCGDNGLFLLKLGLLANRSIEKINLANTKMTCEGWLCVCAVLSNCKMTMVLFTSV